VHRKGEGETFPGIAEIDSTVREFEQGDALQAEISAFLNSIITQQPAIVSGEDGLRALETATEISHLLGKQ
jgi:predicted dehydrogenase